MGRIYYYQVAGIGILDSFIETTRPIENLSRPDIRLEGVFVDGILVFVETNNKFVFKLGNRMHCHRTLNAAITEVERLKRR